MSSKTQQIGRLIVRLFIVIILLSVGFIFLLLPTDPGYASNIIAWLETEGSYISHILGISFLLAGIIGLLLLTKRGETGRTTIQKGPLICSIDHSLFEQAVQKLWEEKFPGYPCETSVRKQKLQIKGNVPKGFGEQEGLSSYIAEQLLSLTGYWGEISLTLTEEKATS
jgi:hypothetical protein